LILSDSGDRIAFGAQRWKERAKLTKPEETPNVEVWNTKDVVVVPAQKVRFRAIENASDVYVWNGGKNAVRISEGLNRSVALVSDLKKAVVANQAAYRTAQTTGVDPVDVDLVDTETGARSHLTKKTYFAPIPSGEGKYLMWFDQKNWTLIDVETGKFVPVTARLRKSFENEETDVPRPVNPYAALPYWLKDDEGVLVQDMYDVFLYRPATDSLTQLTFGQKEGVMYDPVDVIAEDDERGSIKDPIFLSAFHRVDKSSGFAKVSASGEFKALTFDAKAMGGLARAKDTDRMIFTMSTFAEPVSLYLTNTEFSAAKPVLRTNPWIKDYHWGKSELVQFKSRWGVPLQGVLIYPADYDPKRSYPMVTYIYERLSDSLHQFIRPLENSAYNEQWLSQNGYFVFKPDIVYRDGTPGQDAVDCLEPALGAAFAKNVGIDPDRVALMGHSWGGYQTAFVTTVSKRFAVGVAGAPLTELTSMYSTIYWNSGTPNQEIFESSQGRMRLPFWEIPDKYFANSPVWQVQKRTAPLLMTFGDSDGAVDFRQGVQFYTTLRRLGKEAVMLVYPGENHGLARPANRLDYAQRVRHYLDVYLKKAKPEAWITDGVPYSPPAGVPATTGAPMSGSSG
jgi:dipeptidyl aminopeptidase/acylaminoacyl peptidase